MPTSARNRLTGEVRDVETDGVAAEVTVETGSGETVTAVITRGSVDRLALSPGDRVQAVVKATDVMVATGD